MMWRNRVILALTISDVLMISGWGLVMPIIAVFIADTIPGGDVAVAGFATTLFLVVRAVVQIPTARWLDNHEGETDDFWVMMFGNLLLGVAALAYLGASQVWHIYAIQILYGIGTGLGYPSWYAVFTRHIDKNLESTEWSIYNTLVDLGSAIAAGVGGTIALLFGYTTLFTLTAILSFASVVAIFLSKGKIYN